jgi:hypothetical protein
MADGGERALGAFAALPHALLLAVLALLPVDTRLRCREVCRGWRDALSDNGLWTRLDLSEASGDAAAHLKNAAGLLAAAALRAGGQLQCLDVTGCVRLDLAALRGVVGSSAALRVLRVGDRFDAAELADLLRAAPQLQLLHAAELHCDTVESFEALRDEQLFTPLRLGLLRVFARGDDATLLALRLVAATAPVQLYLEYVDLSLAAAVGALVDAALAHQMSDVSFWDCRLSAVSAPALVRLLGGGAMTRLLLRGDAEDAAAAGLWADVAGAALLCDALLANATLCELQLSYLDAWSIPAAGTALLGALTGHASLQRLGFGGNLAMDAPSMAAAAAALGALVAADTLTELDVSNSSLGDAALRPLFDALPGVTRLRTLLRRRFCTGRLERRVHPRPGAAGTARQRLAARANAGRQQARERARGGRTGHVPRL